jgi:hypothetical protein
MSEPDGDFTKQSLVRFDTVLKHVIVAAALRDQTSINQFVQKAVIAYIRSTYPDIKIEERELRWCRNCHRPLPRRDNESGFCRECQRQVGLAKLQKMYST